MGGFISINRSISQEVQKYILIERGKKNLIYWCIGVVILCIVSWSTIFIPVIALGVLIYKYLARKNENKKLYNLLKTGILTKTSLKYISVKEKIVNKRGKKIFIYFYEFKYFDLNEKAHTLKVTFRELLTGEMLHDIPVIFSAANPKVAIIIHEKFKKLKATKKGLFKESKLQVIDGNIEFKG